MKDVNFRKALDDYLEDMDIEEPTLLLDNHSYDWSIIGITEDGRIVYSYEKMIEEFMLDEGCSYEEAVEWLDYNTLRALPYMNSEGRAPIIIYDTKESILEKYGK